MKRIIYTILSLSLFVFASHAQKPVKGNVLTEISLGLNDISDNFYLLNGNFDYEPAIRARYFITDDIALRCDLLFGNEKSSDTYLDPTDDTKSGTEIDKSSMFGLGLGVEKHLGGNSRFSPFVGAGLSFGLGNNSTEFNDATFGGYSLGNKESSSQKSTMFGAEGFIGADYWINNSLYVGAQFGINFLNTKLKDGELDNNGTVSVLLGSSGNIFGNIAAPLIRLGWNLNAK